MALISDTSVIQKSLAALPLLTFHPGEIVLAAGSKTGRLLILKAGAVAIVKDGAEIARVAESGSIFGEISALLDRPHTADVRAVATSQLHAGDAAALLGQDPVALLYVAAVLAHRLDGANQAFARLKNQVRSGAAQNEIGKPLEKIESALAATGASLVYSGYPYDPYA